MGDLRVGDVCRKAADLRPGMRVKYNWFDALAGRPVAVEHVLRKQNNEGDWLDANGVRLFCNFVEEDGVIILDLPEGAPKPAAPSLEEQVPVGSRWRWNERSDEAGIGVTWDFVCLEFEVLRHRPDGLVAYRYPSNDVQSIRAPATILAHATRIDEPTGAGKRVEPGEAVSLPAVDEQGRPYKYTFKNNGEVPVIVEGTTARPAMPPARCAPGCSPSRSCRIVIPVTDQGTRYECPAFAEERVPIRMYWDFPWLAHVSDADEARAMRNQRWEPAPNGLGAFPGRYRFDRRPR